MFLSVVCGFDLLDVTKGQKSNNKCRNEKLQTWSQNYYNPAFVYKLTARLINLVVY